jgi:hypothetical protein
MALLMQTKQLPRLMSVIAAAVLYVGSTHTMPAAAIVGPRILTQDVDRFYKVYDTAGGHPTEAQLQRGLETICRADWLEQNIEDRLVRYRIAKSYYGHAADKRAALRDIIQVQDAKAFLAKIGWFPGIMLP